MLSIFCFVTQEQCLVIVLSNNSHVSQHVIPNLMKEFKKHGYPNVQEIENVSIVATSGRATAFARPSSASAMLMTILISDETFIFDL